MTANELIYRACTSLDDFRQCVQLQKAVWSFSDVDILPSRVFVVAQEIGGQIFGAVEPRGQMVGFVIALPGVRHGRPYLHSHMLGVLPEYQNQRVGRTLKLMQRDDALARGIGLIEWTFDPLELKNAFFNLERLGVCVRRYIPNRYGATTSALHAGLPTDRLVAEWWVDTPRVARVLSGQPPVVQPEQRLEVPADIGEIKKSGSRLAYEIQQNLWKQFERAFADGLVVTGFDRSGAYLLTREAA